MSTQACIDRVGPGALVLALFSFTSAPALAACGDGVWESATEECDDGGLADSDGCSASCTIETGYTCFNAPILNTGADGIGGQATVGDDDDTWSWVDADAPTAAEPAVVAGSCAPAQWVAEPADARWVNRYGCSTVTPEGATTLYTATFEIQSAAAASKTVLTGKIWADNSVDDIVVNGHSTGVSFGPAGYTGPGVDFGTWPSAWYRAGSNTVTVEVYNGFGSGGNPDGLLVSTNAFTTPSVCEELCGDGVHEAFEECEDGNQVDGDGCSATCVIESIDHDGDGVTAADGDCDDADAAVFPGAAELCDGVDNDCDGTLPANELDTDLDGLTGCKGDCDDSDASVLPGAAELCDGLDNDCDGSVPGDEDDGDSDGSPACADCDDADASVLPGAPELCDGLDNDCDGQVPADELDGDSDGHSACEGDCDDADADRNPGATEVCNGLDDDCDDVVPADELDDDGDGQSACEGDCDDTDGDRYAGATEVCNGLDDDCDGSAGDDEGDANADGVLDCDETCTGPADSAGNCSDDVPFEGGCACSSVDPRPLGVVPFALLMLGLRRRRDGAAGR